VSRLIVVSNRLPSLRATPALGGPTAAAGGLASAVLAALQRYPESLWFGWSGRTLRRHEEPALERRTWRGVSFAGLPLSKEELDEYYFGYCNDTLWPLFHCFQSQVCIRPNEEARYATVQRRFSEALLPLLQEGDLLWVHDYHLLLLGRELRRAGWNGPIAFFLHIPFPPLELWQLLRDPADVSEALLSYDVFGVHVPRFAHNYVEAAVDIAGAQWDGTFLRRHGRRQRVGVYPVGIDPEEFLPRREDLERSRRRETLGRVVGDRKILVGVDRLDYTKGIVERLLGFEEFLRTHKEWRNRVVFLQIAAPSRTKVPAYREQKLKVEAQVSRINGELGEHDWMPVRYLYRSYSHDFLARVYREANAALVTPLRDGMNLVAKEFVAAQDPEDPGVLVLSRSAGAAEELREAVIVNPFIASDVARGIRDALEMPLAERRRRQEWLRGRVLRSTADEWSRRLLEDLQRDREGASMEESRR
jgi:trehalose 6-phosphate synthase